MIFGKNARTNNDMIQSKYVISYVGEYVIKKTVWENKYTSLRHVHLFMMEMHEEMLVCPMLVEQLSVSMEV